MVQIVASICQTQYKVKEKIQQSVQLVDFIRIFVLLIIVSTQRSGLSSLIQSTEKNPKESEASKNYANTLSQSVMNEV